MNTVFDILSSPYSLAAAVTYFLVIFPTFLVLRKKEKGFWWVVILISLELALINILFFLSIKYFIHEYFNLKLLYYGYFVSLIIYLTIPILSNRYIKEQKTEKSWKRLLLAYIVTIAASFIPLIGFYYLISLSINAWFKYFN